MRSLKLTHVRLFHVPMFDWLVMSYVVKTELLLAQRKLAYHQIDASSCLESGQRVSSCQVCSAGASVLHVQQPPSGEPHENGPDHDDTCVGRDLCQESRIRTNAERYD